MDIVNIEALIAQGKIVKTADIDPANDYVQIGKYIPNNRKRGGNPNSYDSFVIPLSELLGGGSAYFGDGTTIVLNPGNIFGFASMNISQFTNNSGYVTALTAPNIYNVNGTLTSNRILDRAGFNFKFTDAGVSIVEFDSLSLHYSDGTVSVNWGSSNLYDQAGITSADWDSRQFIASDGSVTINWEFMTLNKGGVLSVDWDSRNLLDSTSIIALDWEQRILKDNAGSNILYWEDPAGVGIGQSVPTARLHVVGASAAYGTYALKVDNIASSPLLYVDNSGAIGMGIASPTNKLHIVGSTYGVGIQVNAGNAAYINLWGNGGGNGGSITMGQEFGEQSLNIYGQIGAGGILRVTNGFAVSNFINNVGIFRAAQVDTYPIWAMGNHNGGTILEAATRLVIYGQNVLATDYILKLKDGNLLGPVDVFTARNDGHISMNQLPVSNVGLVAGELWNNAGVINIV